jgi:hypothetical protein
MLVLIKLVAVLYFEIVLWGMYKDKYVLDLQADGEWGDFVRRSAKGYSAAKLALMATVPAAIFVAILMLLTVRVEASFGTLYAMPKIVEKLYKSGEQMFKLEKLNNAIKAGEVPEPAPVDWIAFIKRMYYVVGYNMLIKEANKRGFDLKTL